MMADPLRPRSFIWAPIIAPNVILEVYEYSPPPTRYKGFPGKVEGLEETRGRLLSKKSVS